VNPVGPRGVGAMPDLSEYLTNIPDTMVRHLVSEIVQFKIQETFNVVEWITKAFWHLSTTDKEFLSIASSFANGINPAREFSKIFGESTLKERKELDLWMQEKRFIKSSSYLKDVEKEIRQWSSVKTNSQILSEIRDVVDYRHHLMVQRLTSNKFNPPPFDQKIERIHRINHFDDIHKEAVNCVDICPMSRILVSASNDCSVKVIDLSDLTLMNDIIIQDQGRKKIKAVCIDSHHNVVFVNEDNLLRIYSILEGVYISEFKGDKLPDYTDKIPNQAAQFTVDYNYLAFRNSSTTILLFDMRTKTICKKYSTDGKMDDYSISPYTDLIAAALSIDCEVVILDMATGQKVCSHETDCRFLTLIIRPSIHYSVG